MANILLVEDDDGDAMLTEGRLKEADGKVEVWRAHDGADALAMLDNGEFIPDVILLDINMPGMDGHETLAKLRADARFAKTPIVILTTSSSSRDIKRAYECCANAYVMKPVTLDAFRDTVGTIKKFWTQTAFLPGAAVNG